jgi:hypothetical protein
MNPMQFKFAAITATTTICVLLAGYFILRPRELAPIYQARPELKQDYQFLDSLSLADIQSKLDQKKITASAVTIALLRLNAHRTQEGAEQVEKFSKAKQPEIRIAVARAVVYLPLNDRALQLITTLANDPDEAVRHTLFTSIPSVSDPQRTKKLMPLLQKSLLRNPLSKSEQIGLNFAIHCVQVGANSKSPSESLKFLIAQIDNGRTETTPDRNLAITLLLQTRSTHPDAIHVLLQLHQNASAPTMLWPALYQTLANHKQKELQKTFAADYRRASLPLQTTMIQMIPVVKPSGGAALIKKIKSDPKTPPQLKQMAETVVGY